MEIQTPAHLNSAEAAYFTRLISGRLAGDWSGPDLIRLERLCKLFVLADKAMDSADLDDPSDEHFEKYLTLERLIVVMCRQLHLHQQPATGTEDLAIEAQTTKQEQDDEQIG